jgi:hypothetical protein
MTEEKTAKLNPALEPEPGTVVQTGDEEEPISEGGKQENSLKAIYKKTRENRELTVREDEEENPDAELIAKMVEEAQDEGEFEHTAETEIDLDARKTPAEAQEDDGEGTPDDEYVESVNHEAYKAEQEEDEPKPIEEETASSHLEYELIDGKVKAVIEGMEFLVPEADVKAAGGLTQYQMNRAANIRFQKAATFGKALQKEREKLAQQQPNSSAERGLPVKDDLDNKAELVKETREKLLDAALDGTEADVDEIVESLLNRKAEKSNNAENSPDGDDDVVASDQVVAEYEANYKQDRAAANLMLSQEFSDIMENSDLRKIASSKYKELQADPNSVGRTAVEMAREAGNFVRNISKTSPRKDTQSTELEARRIKKRVLPQGSEARTRHKPSETKKPRSNKQFIQDLRRKQGNY